MCEPMELGETNLKSITFVLASSEVYEKGLKKAKLCFVARTLMGELHFRAVVLFGALNKQCILV